MTFDVARDTERGEGREDGGEGKGMAGVSCSIVSKSHTQHLFTPSLTGTMHPGVLSHQIYTQIHNSSPFTDAT